MKTIKYIYLLCALFSLGGCEDFLDRPAHNITPDLELDNIADFSASSYRKILDFNASNGHGLYALGEYASDNALKGSILSDGGGLNPQRQYNQFQNFDGINPSSPQFLDGVWNALYPGVEQANINLRNFERLYPQVDSVARCKYVAENRFMRAFYYTFLVNIYGNVPLIPEGEVTPSEYAALTNDLSITELYDYIVNDFRFAANNLPTKNEWEQDSIFWQGRAHKGSGFGYLAKSLLFQAANEIYYNKVDGAQKAAENYKEIVSIVDSMYGQYTLVDNYEQIFRVEGNYNSESLFEVGTASTSEGTTRFAGWRHIQPRNYQGYGFLAPSMNLINQYERNENDSIIDQRYMGTVLYGETNQLSGQEHPAEKLNAPIEEQPFNRTINGDLIVGSDYNAQNITGSGFPNRYCRKSVQPHPTSSANNPQENLGGANLKFLRWAEILLVGAEAAYYDGQEGKAKGWLKEVRRRANLDENMVDALSGHDLLKQIWKDKRIEVALEWSNRYFEMVRIDKIFPGYMKACMDAKVKDEQDAIFNHLEATNGWEFVYDAAKFPMDKTNYKELIPLTNGFRAPKHYTMPISNKIFNKMIRLKQTEYYR